MRRRKPKKYMLMFLGQPKEFGDEFFFFSVDDEHAVRRVEKRFGRDRGRQEFRHFELFSLSKVKSLHKMKE